MIRTDCDYVSGHDQGRPYCALRGMYGFCDHDGSSKDCERQLNETRGVRTPQMQVRRGGRESELQITKI